MTPPRTLRFQPGDRYGRLTVLSETRLANTPGRVRHGFTVGLLGALCRCNCGTMITVAGSALVSGNTRSCGCLRKEVAAARVPVMAEAAVTHGLSRSGAKHPLYQTWRGMMTRCYNPAHRYYKHYGGRGITVCEQWHDALKFACDIGALLGPRPPGFTLDRIDNDGGYEPGNIRWADRRTQAKNKRKPKPRINADQVAEIRARRAANGSLSEVASACAVSISTVHKLTRDLDVDRRRKASR